MTEAVTVEDRREVEQRTRHGRDGDAVLDGGFVRPQREFAGANARPPAATERRDFVQARIRPQIPEHPCRSATEHRSRPARENGRHPSAARRQQWMPDREHAAMHGVQSPGVEAPADRPPPEPLRDELARRHDAVLARGELRDPALISPTRRFRTVCVLSRRVGGHGRQGGAGVRARGALDVAGVRRYVAERRHRSRRRDR